MQSTERNERRTENNKVASNQIATAYLYARLKQYFGEEGSARIRWLQVGIGERPTFDEACKSWLLSQAHRTSLKQAADKEPFSAFAPLHQEWVQATQERYRMLVLAL